MNKLISLCLAVGICGLAGRMTMAQTKPKVGLVLPGDSILGVKLGDDASRFEAAFPKRPETENHSPSGTVGDQCPTEIYYWSDLAPDTSVATAYLKDGAISQLSVQGPMFSLPNGLKTGATEERVKQAYPKGQMYVLLYSGGKVNGGRDLHYWVAREAGIAFELAWWQTKMQRLVEKIDVFTKGSEFRPEGCISQPQEWQKVKQTPHVGP